MYFSLTSLKYIITYIYIIKKKKVLLHKKDQREDI